MKHFHVYVTNETAAERRAAARLSQTLLSVYHRAGVEVAMLPVPAEGSAGHVCFVTEGDFNRKALAAKRPTSEEGYLLQIDNSGDMLVASGGRRGKVYGMHDLCERIVAANGVPGETRTWEEPYFGCRRWSAAISNTGRGAPWDERLKLLEGLKRIKRFIEMAAEYRISSLEINGRPFDGWDIDWVLPYERYKEFRSVRPLQDRKRRMQLLQCLAKEAEDFLVDLYVWSHELYFPPEFFAFYPEAAGVDYPVCPSSKFVQDFIKNKYRELFASAPSLKGVVLSINESGYFSILTDQGCMCSKCRRLSISRKISMVVNLVAEACREQDRDIVVRTFQHTGEDDYYGHKELDRIRQAYKSLPAYAKVMSKYCPLDFCGGNIIDEPLIGVFKNDHVVEFSLDREWQGRTFIPCITPEDFKTRIRHAVKKKCVGVVGRVDFPFPEMEPEETFDHPNEFNVYVFSRLSWDPDVDIDRCWKDWAEGRYGSAAAPAVIDALKKTEEITERLFFTRGVPVVNYHNMIASRKHSWSSMVTRLPSKWDKSNKAAALTAKFLHPDEKFIRTVMADGDRAYELARQALKSLRRVHGTGPECEITKLIYYFEKLRDYSVLRKHLVELFFRYLALKHRRMIDFHGQAFDKFISAGDGIICQAVKMEQTHGRYSWPVFSPDRGVSAYEFVQQHLASFLQVFLGQEVPLADETRWAGSSWVQSQALTAPRHPVVRFWDDVLEVARGRVGDKSLLDIGELTAAIDAMTWKGRRVRLLREGKAFDLPVGVPIKGPRSVRPVAISRIQASRSARGIAISHV